MEPEDLYALPPMEDEAGYFEPFEVERWMLSCAIGEKKAYLVKCRADQALGLQLAGDRHRAIICGVGLGSPASAAGVHDSTFLTAVDGEPVADQSLDTLLEMVEEAVETKGWVELEVALPVAPAAPPSPAKPAAREAPPTGHATLPSHVSHNVSHPVETSKAHVHETAIPSDFAACATFEAVPTVKTWQPSHVAAAVGHAELAKVPQHFLSRQHGPRPYSYGSASALRTTHGIDVQTPPSPPAQYAVGYPVCDAEDEEDTSKDEGLKVHIGINTGVGMLETRSRSRC